MIPFVTAGLGISPAGSDARKAAQVVKERRARLSGAGCGRDTSPLAHDSVVGAGEGRGKKNQEEERTKVTTSEQQGTISNPGLAQKKGEPGARRGFEI